MKRLVFLACISLLGFRLFAQEKATRAGVGGVAGIRLLAEDLDKSREFYGKRLGLAKCPGPTDAPLCFQINPVQKIEIESLRPATGTSRLVFVAFRTNDIDALRNSLSASGIPVGEKIVLGDGSEFFEILDPEGHNVRFVQFPETMRLRTQREVQVSSQMIHVGYVVQDRARLDHLYQELLGFHMYWRGGMKDSETDWVDMQVPDKHGAEWLEYMLNVSPNADKRELGIMNHIALGVPDIHAAEQQLRRNGAQLTEEPQIGRDGKWQLNLYDPDLTRVEFMEFTPVQKPCCSEFTGPHPGPQPPSKAPTKP